MSGQISNHEARRRVVQLGKFADGFWDMLLGGVLILLSLYPVTRELLGPVLNLFLFFGLLALLIVGLGRVQQAVSVPRIGVVRPARGPLTTVTLITLFLVTLSLVIATLFMTDTLRGPTSGPPLAGDIFFAALVVGFFAVFAHIVGVPRLYLYGWLFGLGMLASAALQRYAGFTFNLPMFLAGLIIVAIGLSQFRRFRQRYPVSDEEQ